MVYSFWYLNYSSIQGQIWSCLKIFNLFFPFKGQLWLPLLSLIKKFLKATCSKFLHNLSCAVYSLMVSLVTKSWVKIRDKAVKRQLLLWGHPRPQVDVVFEFQRPFWHLLWHSGTFLEAGILKNQRGCTPPPPSGSKWARLELVVLEMISVLFCFSRWKFFLRSQLHGLNCQTREILKGTLGHFGSIWESTVV